MGYEQYPEKYKAIADISLKLAYSPWKIDQNNMNYLSKYWSKNELI